MCDPKVINSSVSTLNTTVSNLFAGSIITNADDAPLGVSSMSNTGTNCPFSFWATILTVRGTNTNYVEQFALPFSNGESTNLAYRVKDNNVWYAWKYIPDKNLYNNLVGNNNITLLSSIVTVNGGQNCIIIGNLCYIHLCFWYTQNSGHAVNTQYNFASLPSGYTYELPSSTSAQIIGDGSHTTGRVATIGYNGTYLTISSPSGIFANDHMQFDIIGRATKT